MNSNTQSIKRKVKSNKQKVKPNKRKVKSIKRKVKSIKRKVNSGKLNKPINQSNKINSKGYCESTILDENELDDPCNIHTTMNECDTETKDNEYWRSYNCKWKN